MTHAPAATVAGPGGVAVDGPRFDGAVWARARRALDGLPGGAGLNIAHEAVDRHVAARGDRVAFRWLRRDGTTTEATFRQLAARSNRFANALQALGVDAGERVFTLLGRRPELYVSALGTLKNRSVLCPLFASFGPDPIVQRLRHGNARALVTTAALYDRKVAPRRAELPELAHVVLVDSRDGAPAAGVLAFDALLAAASEHFTIPPTAPDDLALLHYTSGTTGPPKGALHVHDAVVVHHATASSVLGLRPDDVFWCTADPGWVTGTSYGIIAPLVLGVTSVVDEAEFDPERWYRILEAQRVTVWYTAPTALRMLRAAGTDLARRFDLSALRVVASVGEPLAAELVRWGEEAFGRPVHDTWWQTETGGIMIATPAGTEVRPGAMGRPLPGVEVAVLARGADGRARVRDGAVEAVAPGTAGELAIRTGWPSMFRGYLHDAERTRRSFAGDWYLTGDVVRRDADGWLWFVGRADDVINSAGHLVGPFEVERVLLEHPDVVEAAAIGVPDPMAGEVVEAFVVLRSGCAPTDDLRLELIAFARARLGPAVAPRDIAFETALPTTSSGKILRRVLRAGALDPPDDQVDRARPTGRGDRSQRGGTNGPAEEVQP